MKQSVMQLTRKHCYPPLVVDKLALSFLLLETYITHTQTQTVLTLYCNLPNAYTHTHARSDGAAGRYQDRDVSLHSSAASWRASVLCPSLHPQGTWATQHTRYIYTTIIVINQCSRKVFQTVYMYSIVCTIVHIIPLLPLLCKLILLLSVCIIDSSSHKVKVHYSSHYLNLYTLL